MEKCNCQTRQVFNLFFLLSFALSKWQVIEQNRKEMKKAQKSAVILEVKVAIMFTIFSNDFSNIAIVCVSVCGFGFEHFPQQHYQIIIITVLCLNFCFTGLLGVRFGSVVFYLLFDLLFDLSSRNVFVLYHFLRSPSLCCCHFFSEAVIILIIISICQLSDSFYRTDVYRIDDTAVVVFVVVTLRFTRTSKLNAY